MEQDQPQVMMGETETAQQPVFRHREVAAISALIVEGNGKVLAGDGGPVTAGIHLFLKDGEKARNLSHAWIPQATARHIQHRHIGGHGGAWRYLPLAAVEQGRKRGGTGWGWDKTRRNSPQRQGRRHEGAATK